MNARPVSRWEYALAGVTLFMFCEAFLPRLLSPAATDVTGEIPESTLLRFLWLPFYALIGLGLLFAAGETWRAILRSPFLVLLGLLAIASSMWSIDPDLSFRRGLAVFATTMLGVYMAARFDWLTGLRLLAFVWLALMAASLVSGIIAPHFAIMGDPHPGAWSAGWQEKNQLGGHASRASLLFAFLAWRDGRYRKQWIAGFLIACLLVLLSKSATSLLGVMLGVAVLGAAWWMLKGRTWTLTMLWAGACVGGLVVLIYVAAPGLLLGLLGKDETLTGRTDIWVELGNAIDKKPALGYGYLAFWGLESEPRYWLQKAVDWNAPSGHNGWLDLAISLGITGVVIFAIDFLLSTWRAVRLATVSPVGVFALGFLAQFMLFAMSESIILAQNSILWATYVMVATKLALERKSAGATLPPFTGEVARRVDGGEPQGDWLQDSP